MLTSSGGGGVAQLLTVADRGRGGGGDKICQNLADVLCERSLSNYLMLKIGKNNFIQLRASIHFDFV